MTRRFDDDEVAAILREATAPEDAERSRDGGLLTSHADGFTLAELREIAAEAGIDPGRVERAARSLISRPSQSPFRIFVGTDSRVRVRSDFEGVVDDRTFSEALQQIRSSVSLHGASNALPGGIQWTAQDEWGTRSVSISTTHSGTSLEVEGDFDNAARGAAAGAAVAAGVGVVGTVAAVASLGPVGWALAPVAAVGAMGIPRLLAGWYVRREGVKLRRLADRLRTLIHERVGPQDPSDPR